MLGMFDKWNEKLIKKLNKSYPFIDDLYMSALLTKIRVHNLRDKLSIPSTGTKHRHATAFYLGAIEGDIRKYLKIPIVVNNEKLIHLIFSVALYLEVKDEKITCDSEWSFLGSEYNQVLFDIDNDWYRKRGLGYAALLDADPEENWELFEKKISEE